MYFETSSLVHPLHQYDVAESDQPVRAQDTTIIKRPTTYLVLRKTTMTLSIVKKKRSHTTLVWYCGVGISGHNSRNYDLSLNRVSFSNSFRWHLANAVSANWLPYIMACRDYFTSSHFYCTIYQYIYIYTYLYSAEWEVRRLGASGRERIEQC